MLFSFMFISFLRHASTASLENKVSQPDNEPLSPTGLVQAQQLHNRFSATSFDLVITSPHLRALQTAQVITSTPLINDLFTEVRKPKEVIGQPKDNPQVVSILNQLREMYLVDPSWHYSDEENFEDLKSRGIKALNYLQNLNVAKALVVSHGNFIALLTGLMLFGDNYPVILSLNLKNFLRLSSAGISTFEFTENRWRLLCWNDTCHLNTH